MEVLDGNSLLLRLWGHELTLQRHGWEIAFQRSELDLQPLHSQAVIGGCSAEGLIEAGQPAPLPQAESDVEGIAGPQRRGLVEAQPCGHGEISHFHRDHLKPCLPKFLKPLPGLIAFSPADRLAPALHRQG